MEHFCTIFDSAFLPQGLSLHRSLERHAKPFTLWVLCMDELVEKVFREMNVPHVRLIPLSEIETPSLLAVKSGRSRAEYCWTLTPFFPKAVMDIDPTVERVTYVDTDCWFISDPCRILKEMDNAGKDVLITLHDSAVGQDQIDLYGKFAVQFMPFKKTKAGLELLSWWQEKVLEWCFARVENNLFGDQKYLDHWPEQYGSSVHVLQNRQLALGPWNAVFHKDAADLQTIGCMYHFHNLRIYKGGVVSLCLGHVYHLPSNVLEVFYQPYLKDLDQSIQAVFKAGYDIPFLPFHSALNDNTTAFQHIVLCYPEFLRHHS